MASGIWRLLTVGPVGCSDDREGDVENPPEPEVLVDAVAGVDAHLDTDPCDCVIWLVIDGPASARTLLAQMTSQSASNIIMAHVTDRMR